MNTCLLRKLSFGAAFLPLLLGPLSVGANDVDADGIGDFPEIYAGTDPEDPLSFPSYTPSNFSAQANSSLSKLMFPFPGFVYGNNLLLGGFPFSLSSAGNNIWHSLFASGATERSLTLQMVVPDVLGFATLISTYWGRKGKPYAKLRFQFSDGTSFDKELAGDRDIRDYNKFNRKTWTTKINGTSTVLAWAGNNGSPRLDRQYVNLSALGHGGKTLTSVTLVDYGPSLDAASNPRQAQRLFLAGATAVSQGSANPPPPREESVSASLVPSKRKVSAGKKASLMVLVRNNSTEPESVRVAFFSSRPDLVTAPEPQIVQVPGKKEGAKKPALARRKIAVQIPAGVRASVSIAASVGGAVPAGVSALEIVD